MRAGDEGRCKQKGVCAGETAVIILCICYYSWSEQRGGKWQNIGKDRILTIGTNPVDCPCDDCTMSSKSRVYKYMYIISRDGSYSRLDPPHPAFFQ
jgi:hypothetical protein